MNITNHLREHEKLWTGIIIAVSIIVVALVGFLIYQSQSIEEFSNQIYLLPQLNAIINTIVSILLVAGFILIKQRKIQAHKFAMLGALCLSILFLISYVIYHHSTPHTEFGGEGFLKYLYFFILITHILLAIVIVPMALFTVMRAFQNKLDKHQKIGKITLPVWFYVSITGVIIYLMISPYYPV